MTEGTISALISGLSLAASGLAVLFTWQGHRLSQRFGIKETADRIFTEWWSQEMRELRLYFMLEFVPTHRSKVLGLKLTQIQHTLPEDKGRMIRLCYFFDRIGWLASAGLIDVDYVLGPMQHVLRRLYFATESFLHEDQKANPLYYHGFVWLFERSNRKGKDQASLISKRFVRPRTLGRKETTSLRNHLRTEEELFLASLSANSDATESML